MIDRKQLFTLLTLLLLFGVLLSACSKNSSSEAPAETDTKEGESQEQEEAVDSGEPKQGGTIVGAMYSAPTGMFNPIFYEEAYEANIIDFVFEGLFSQDNSLNWIPNLAKEWDTNDDHTELTVTLEDGVKWHDGEDFTAEDVVFTYQMISDPDYVKAGGIRTNYVTQLLGYDAYVAGETDEFEGVVAEDDLTVTFKFAEPNINPEFSASFLIIPKHVYEDVPVAEMPEFEASLQPGKVIGTGPFKFTDMIEREQYVLERNDDYWKAQPYLDKIVWKVVEQSVMTGLLENGEIDFVAEPGGIAPPDYEIVDGYDHINIIEQADFGYQLLGFKHNHRTAEDVESGELNPDNWNPNKKIPKEVRQAIAWAIDRQALIGTGPGQGLLHGKGQIINSPIAVQFWAHDKNAAVDYNYNPDKAAEILDEAGYKMGNDGFRTDPDGNEWVINMDYPTGNELRERSAPIIKKYLEDVGIKVNLRQPKEMSAYVEGLTNDNTDWDLYLLGWSLGSGDPDPLGLWGIKDAYNFSRWNNEESQAMLENALKAPEAFDQDYRKKIYSEWTHLFSDDLPALILYAQNNLWAHHVDINGIDPRPYTMYANTHLWWLDRE
ncbi:ABC transporter substrate-binding protein [Virgibacillus sp. W0430]|uniref:ABC transporter substrate-binding protein n=1 Tax=Virgibacillus sp. W0430 TaxID=3391580 RepID=UPI003F44FB27